MSDPCGAFATNLRDFLSRRAIRRGMLRIAAAVPGLAGAIVRGDVTSDAKPKSKGQRRRKRRKQRQCSGAEDCAAPENPCQTVICRRHTCRVRSKPDNTSCGDELLCRDGECAVACDAVCTGGRVCRDDECVCPESGECQISPTRLDGWLTCADDKVSFVVGPATPPLGAGSVRLSTVANLGSAISNDRYDGTPIAEITALNFATFVEDGTEAADGGPFLRFDVLFGEGVGTGTTTLAFEPVNTVDTPVLPDLWQIWDALGANARWTVEEGPGGCAEGCLMSWGEVLAAFPDAAIVGPLTVRSGSGASDAAGHVDALRVNDLSFDFEPDAP